MSAITRYTFNKNERLTHKPTIDKLFQTKGNRIVAKPLSLIFHEIKLTSESPCQLLISVPKKKFRRAVHRNRIKRLIRESYRMQKHRLYEVLGDSKQLALGIVFLSTEIPTYKTVNRAVKKLIDDLSTRVS